LTGTCAGPDEIERYKLEIGDLLLTEVGDFDKLGRGSVWRGEIELCIYQNHVFAVRFNQSEVLPEFAEYEMQSWYAKTYFLGVAKRTTNLASINKTQLSAFPIRYPPKKEQQGIVRYLDSVKTEIEALQEIQAQDEQSLEQVEQAILAQAFRGGL
jgi:type I restriction enzyme, S subunit